MNMNRVVEILRTEKECVERQDTPKCNRDCGNCDLLLPTEEVKQAYTLAIGCIEGTQSLLDEATIADVAYVLDCLRLLRDIYNTGDCNNCKIKNDCEYVPKVGRMVRYNCPFYRKEGE